MRVAFLTNILTPYRVSFYDELQNAMSQKNSSLRVFVMTDCLPMRPWSYGELKRNYTQLLKGKKCFINRNDYLINPGVVREIIKFDPDFLIVAGSWTYPSFLLAAYSRRIREKCFKLLWTESHNKTGIRNKTKTSSLIRSIKKRVIDRFDGFCLPGKYALDALADILDIGKKTIVHLPNLVDNQFYNEANSMRRRRDEIRKMKGIPTESFVFFSPASLYELKGHIPFFLNVNETIQGENVIFVLAGEGPYEQKIIEVTENHNINTVMCGYQTQEEIREWLALADAFLLPSLSDANPLSNIEAAWAGLPLCISCYVGNGPELVEDGVNGVVFDTLDKKSVHEKIGFVINQNKQWLTRAGTISRQKAKDGFEIHRETRNFIGALEAIKGKH